MGLKPLNLFLPYMNKTESLISESQCYIYTYIYLIVVVLSCYVQLSGESLDPIDQIVAMRQSAVLNGRFAT